MNENEEKIRELLEQEEVPEELSPENIKKQLDEDSQAKRRRFSIAAKTAGIAAACALICGTAVFGAANVSRHNDNGVNESVIPETQENAEENADESISKSESETEASSEKTEELITGEGSFMNGASSYEQIYSNLKKAGDRYRYATQSGGGDMYFTDDADYAAAEEAEEVYDSETAKSEGNSAQTAAPSGVGGFGDGGDESETFSETYNQEEGVLEADIVKTNGSSIFYIYNYSDYENMIYDPVMNIAQVDNGSFVSTDSIDLTPDMSNYYDDSYKTNADVYDMYVYDGMIEVIGTVQGYQDYFDEYGEYNSSWNDRSNQYTFVSFYDENTHDLIGTYFQEGYYNNVRISPDGYMYLLSNYISQEYSTIEDADDIEAYIPKCGTNDESECLPPEDILLPEEFDDSLWVNYTVISSIDLNAPGEFSVKDNKALAGYSGMIYSSADNIYTVLGWEESEITRISIAGGEIVPAASGKIEGYVRDQFSMSEYEGYFRVASTVQKWESYGNAVTDWLGWTDGGEFNIDNRVYVLDMDMNIVGSIGGFGEGETIKSVNFNGDIANVVTYEQTDPLFSIDLSDPANPTILDELKLPGYSTYMQRWNDGLLLGFGVNADENGVENGIKLTMFDNSDQNDLKEAGTFIVNTRDESDENNYSYSYSDATWQRKALLIAPEKNLIGFPLITYTDTTDQNGNYESSQSSKYIFLSYDNGEFTLKGEIDGGKTQSYSGNECLNRAVYIGDYVYAVSGRKIIAADIAGISVTDEAEFGLG